MLYQLGFNLKYLQFKWILKVLKWFKCCLAAASYAVTSQWGSSLSAISSCEDISKCDVTS
jgi:hypothetical protein